MDINQPVLISGLPEVALQMLYIVNVFNAPKDTA